jgi:hypothetical protein
MDLMKSSGSVIGATAGIIVSTIMKGRDLSPKGNEL